MKWCDDHWAKLRDAIDEVGLSEYVAENAGALAERINLETSLQGPLTAGTMPDPLLASMFAVMDNLARQGGAGMFMVDGCPVCYANKAHEEGCTDPDCDFSYDQWLMRAAQDCKDAYDARAADDS
jgi:hypothetical protein